ncbi:hypothetical protein B4U80_04782 [Leptotrombidium deliense]|uniref:Uncharacterized protein n=1 Tax=Leptotrombidium deliense TaxID=299467 RepID=A0A443RT90_9ACAR|nr:hypothetical protein B4U80_04782 [Leptotrombidium deliense]
MVPSFVLKRDTINKV